MMKKGFWVVTLLLLVVQVSALEFEWKLTQSTAVRQCDPSCHALILDGADALTLASSDCNIIAQGKNVHSGDWEYYIQVGVAILSGNIVVAEDWWNEHEGAHEWVVTDTIRGKGNIVKMCSDSFRYTSVKHRIQQGPDCATADIYVPISNIKSNVTFAEGKKPLGNVSDFAKRCYVTGGTYTPETTNPNVYMYIDTQENVIACTDMNQDKQCDIEQASTCPSPGDWNAKWYATSGDYCCGGDQSYKTEPCAYYNNLNAICGKDTAGDWKWVASAVEGQSRKLACPTQISFLAGGESSIYYCGNKSATVFASNAFGSFDDDNMREIAHHEFLCTPSTATITECAGDEGTLSDGNNYKTTGEWINQTGIQFCSAENTWITDLDNLAKGKKTCIAARQKNTWPGIANTPPRIAWTGSKCCGDPADDNTLQGTYEDPWPGGEGTAGGCYNNTFIASGEFADSEQKIINYKGNFTTCNQSRTLGSITTHIQQTCGAPLLNATLTGTQHHIVCTPSGNWMFTNNTATTQATTTTWSTSQGCCLNTQCWDGQSCREVGEYYQIGDRGYRCAPN